ncbi:hypothetical protein [Amycolatopsis australiensis]|uniref:hypothetical protein n=1 Tax=Amycolatopsis australiensis TaxID=546364 RepID=UPI0015A5095F|nr:hypothetical protein [Amycolatopsis australiensis]
MPPMFASPSVFVSLASRAADRPSPQDPLPEVDSSPAGTQAAPALLNSVQLSR